ncbi:[citrate (pro-3S)-lyase] ligase [Shewanella marina]|uniref:[citrate (pro-3S)-lyase] ligase n=1 Tax=Shewanella marina TaxID=487319 RepID=UPI0004708705|nr:[citrate (pro-3S)-lyase] ligase [Shewanella marina]
MQIQYSIVSANSMLYQTAIEQLIASQGLRYESDIEYFCIAHNQQQVLVGCVGLAGHILKCFAIENNYQGAGISRAMVTEIILCAYQLHRKSLSIFTAPDKVSIFQSMGFTALTSLTRSSVLLVNRPEQLLALQHQLSRHKIIGKRIAAIEMNANPFTKGHAYLIEQAAQACDWVHVFVVREENKPFSFSDRLAMVRNGCQHLRNITVHEGNDYMISKRTFPSYFLKESHLVNQLHAEIDCEIFVRYIAPCLGITHRYIGSEPNCPITQNYNQVMMAMLPPQISVVEIKRLALSGISISASTVRNNLLNATTLVASLLPISTINYLIEHHGYALQI